MTTTGDTRRDRRQAGALAAWGRFEVRRRRYVLTAWVALVVALAILAATVGGRFADDFQLPNTDSERAFELLGQNFPRQAGEPATLVLRSATDLRDPGVQARVERLLEPFAVLPEVVDVSSPYENGGQAISRDGAIAYATLQYGVRSSLVALSSVDALVELVDDLSADDLLLEVGGPVVQVSERAPPGKAELVGLGTAVVVLLVAFGSVVAMGLPIVTALFALGSGLLLIMLATRVLGMSSFTPAFAAMIGIGVGVDYALIIVTRFREELATGIAVEEAVATAIDTAGRAVIFAGAAVVIALLALLAIGIPFVAAMGVAGALVVGASVLVATTLLPALLGFAGRSVDRWRVGLFHVESAEREGFWYRLATTVQRRPLLWAGAGLAVLLLLAAPVLDIRLGSSDAGNNPTSFRSRRAYDLLTEGFGPGFNGPLLLAVELREGRDELTLDRLVQSLAATEDVAFVAPPRFAPGGEAAVITVVPAGSPQDESTRDLIDQLRSEVIPSAVTGGGVTVYVGGLTAAFADIGTRISERLPLFFALVIGLNFLLLMAVIRSIAVAVKAAAMNLLSIGAAYGVLVAIFQWGWLGGLVGAGRAGPIESFVPMMLFAILFGLSMDYEVFLLSRIREEYVRSGSNREAIASGLSQTARVITAAAAIMISVFLSFGLSEGRVIKEFGLGLAAAILIDATLVRIVLVPAIMQLLGDRNWWLPAWLDRLLPHIQIEGAGTLDVAEGGTREAAS